MRSDIEVEEFAVEALARYTAKCPKCSGTDKTCECWRNYRRARLAYEACIPQDFWSVKASDITNNKAVFDEVVLPYCKKLGTALNHGYGLLLLGDNGVGKTMFASFVGMYAIHKARTVYYTTLPQLDWDIKKGFNDREAERQLQWMLTSDFLIIDEMGKERKKRDNQYSDQQVERILKQRFDDSRPMVIASNMDADELGASYGSTVGSMLHGKFQTVHMEPGDFREKLHTKMLEDMGYGK